MKAKIKLELETFNASRSMTSHVSHEVDLVDQTKPGALIYQIGPKTVSIPWWRVVKVVVVDENEYG